MARESFSRLGYTFKPFFDEEDENSYKYGVDVYDGKKFVTTVYGADYWAIVDMSNGELRDWIDENV